MKNEKTKALYVSPELEIIAFEIGDIITTSDQTSNGPVPDENEDVDWFNN